MRNQKDLDRVIRFLKSLNEHFSAIRSQIMLLDPLPSINKIFSLVIQQKRQFATENVLDSKATIHISDTTRGYTIKIPQGRGNGSYKQFSKPPIPAVRRGTTKRTCTFCGKNGHTIEVCYKKHGYLPGHKFHNSSRSAANAVNVENKASDNATDDFGHSFSFTAE